jgi:hypothetical protein
LHATPSSTNNITASVVSSGSSSNGIRPNRPYSYYAATNLNPLDCADAEFSSDLNKLIEVNVANAADTKTVTSPVSVCTKPQKSKLLYKINQLSLSLSELKSPTSSSTQHLANKRQTSKPPTTNPLARKNPNKTKAYSYCDRQANTADLMQTADASKSTLSRFNKFIRNIFRSKSSKTTKTPNVNQLPPNDQTDNLKFAKLFGNFRQESSLSSLSLASASNSTSSSFKGRSKKYKYNLATQQASRVSTATTVTSTVDLRKNSQKKRGGVTDATSAAADRAKSVSMYASTTTHDNEITPVLHDQRQRWMRNVLERLLVMDDIQRQQHDDDDDDSDDHVPLHPTPHASRLTLSVAKVDDAIDADPMIITSPLTSIVNEARSSMFQSMTASNLPLILSKQTILSEIAEKIKAISMKTGIDVSILFTTPYFVLDIFDSIPFIDDDAISGCSVDLTAPCKEDQDEEQTLGIEDLIQNLTYDNFDSMVTKMMKYHHHHSQGQVDTDFIWYRVVFVFEFVFKVVQVVVNLNYSRSLVLDSGKREEIILSLKEMAANLIHLKYCDWIHEQGGWISLKKVQDSILFKSSRNSNGCIH